MRKEKMDRLEMRSGHGEDVSGSIDQRSRQRLTTKVTDVDTFVGADLDCIKAGRLSANRVDTGGSDFNVVAMSDQPLEKTFRNWASADIAGADEENTFHDARRAITSLCKLESEQAKSMCWEVLK